MRHVKCRHPQAYAKIAAWQADNPGKRLKDPTSVCAPIEGDDRDYDSVLDWSEDIEARANALANDNPEVQMPADVEVEGSAVEYMREDIADKKPAQTSKPLVPMTMKSDAPQQTPITNQHMTVSHMFENTPATMVVPTVSVQETHTFIVHYEKNPAAILSLHMHLGNIGLPQLQPTVYHTQPGKLLADLQLINTAMLSKEKLQNVVLAALMFKDASSSSKVIARVFKECPMAPAARKDRVFAQQLEAFFGNIDVAGWFLERAHAIDEQSLVTMRIIGSYKYGEPVRILQAQRVLTVDDPKQLALTIKDIVYIFADHQGAQFSENLNASLAKYAEQPRVGPDDLLYLVCNQRDDIEYLQLGKKQVVHWRPLLEQKMIDLRPVSNATCVKYIKQFLSEQKEFIPTYAKVLNEMIKGPVGSAFNSMLLTLRDE